MYPPDFAAQVLAIFDDPWVCEALAEGNPELGNYIWRAREALRETLSPEAIVYHLVRRQSCELMRLALRYQALHHLERKWEELPDGR